MSPANFRLVVYARDRWHEACPTLRVTGPANASGFELVPGYDWDTGAIRINPSQVDGANAVVICRDFPRYRTECLEIIARTHRQGIPLIYETDDDLTQLPLTHADFIYYQVAAPMILRTMLEADRIITSTAFLKEKFSPFHDDIHLVHNQLNDMIWKIADIPAVESSPLPLVIGYFGTHTHKGDIEMVLPALEHILNHLGEGVLLKIWGGCLPHKLATHPRVQLVSEGIFDYAQFARHIQQQKVDVWIAPLIDTTFNRAKSAIKFLEYSATAHPGVYSRIDPYEAVIRQGDNGFLASSSEEWISCLEQLLRDTNLRRKMGQKALESVRENWLLSRNASLFAEAYRSSRCRAPGVEYYTQEQSSAALDELAVATQPVLERLDKLSYLERAISENSRDASVSSNSVDGLFQMIRDAQQYGAARDAELSAIRSSTTYRLADFFGRLMTFPARLLNWARGIMAHPSKNEPTD